MEIENFNNNSEDVSMNGNSLIIDVITDNFMTDVIEQSKETPVIVDFWAPWCEPVSYTHLTLPTILLV